MHTENPRVSEKNWFHLIKSADEVICEFELHRGLHETNDNGQVC